MTQLILGHSLLVEHNILVSCLQGNTRDVIKALKYGTPVILFFLFLDDFTAHNFCHWFLYMKVISFFILYFKNISNNTNQSYNRTTALREHIRI